MASASLSAFPSSTVVSRLPRSRIAASRVTFLRRRQLRVSASCAAATAERTATRLHIGASSGSSLYEILGVQAGANCQEIKAAYRRLARVLHPDAAPASASADCAGREFMKLHEAYSTLSDPQKRADYDRTLSARRRRGVSTSAAAARAGSVYSGFQAYTGTSTRRKWETDQCW